MKTECMRIEWDGPRWFSFVSPIYQVRGERVVLWQIFNRHFAPGSGIEGDHAWGVNLLQIGLRSLFYVGFSGRALLFSRVP